MNLLQPQDRRSRAPGDSREAVAARRRIIVSGIEDGMLSEVAAILVERQPDAILDVGCGEGTLLERAAGAAGCEAVGLDISTPAIDLAARTYPRRTWIVANADRRLPFADESFDVVASVTSRRNGSELRRVLRPGGKLVVVVPSADDLVELRTSLYGRSTSLSTEERIAAGLGGGFELRRTSTVKTAQRLVRDQIADVLAATYRGARRSERDKVGALEAMEVTFSRDILVFEAT